MSDLYAASYSQIRLVPNLGRHWASTSAILVRNSDEEGWRTGTDWGRLKSQLQKGARQGHPMASHAAALLVRALRSVPTENRERYWGMLRTNLHNRLMIIMCEEVFSALNTHARVHLLELYQRATSSDLNPLAYVALVQRLQDAKRTHVRLPSYINALVMLVHKPPYAHKPVTDIPELAPQLQQKVAALRAAAAARSTAADLYGFQYDVKDQAGLAGRYREKKKSDEKTLRRLLKGRLHAFTPLFKALQDGVPGAAGCVMEIARQEGTQLHLPLETHALHRFAAKIGELNTKKMHMTLMTMRAHAPGVAGRYELPEETATPTLPQHLVYSDAFLKERGVLDKHVGGHGQTALSTFAYFAKNGACTAPAASIMAESVTLDGVVLTITEMERIYVASKVLMDMYPAHPAPTIQDNADGAQFVGERTADDRFREAQARGHVVDVDAQEPAPKRTRTNEEAGTSAAHAVCIH